MQKKKNWGYPFAISLTKQKLLVYNLFSPQPYLQMILRHFFLISLNTYLC